MGIQESFEPEGKGGLECPPERPCGVLVSMLPTTQGEVG